MLLPTIDSIAIAKKTLIFREDFNVPISGYVIQSDIRIKAALPGIRQALDGGAKVRLLSHLGRPAPGFLHTELSLRPVAARLQELLGIDIEFKADLTKTSSQIALYENVRFFAGEYENSPELAKRMGSLGDVFVFDAFASAHRAQASTVGICDFVNQAVAGPLLMSEINALDSVIDEATKPVVAVIGGAKVSSKLEVLKSLVTIVDAIIIGGAMANTFLAAKGIDVKDSLYEPDLISSAKEILSNDSGCDILLPEDYVWSNNKIMDIGMNSVEIFADKIASANTILCNGPMGVFEQDDFASGTKGVLQAIALSSAYSIAGGGDTIAALEKWGLSEHISYISTGGGAFLEYIEGRDLPAIRALIDKNGGNYEKN